LSFALSCDYYNKLTKKKTHKTKWTQVGLIMTMSANMRTPLTNSTIMIRQLEDYKVGGRRTWVCFAKHEILHFLQWQQKHLAQHHVKSSSPQVPTCGYHWLIAQCQFDNWRLQGKGQKDMFLLSQDMKSSISCNDHRNISHNIMWSHPLPKCQHVDTIDNNTMLIQQHKNCKVGGKNTWVYSCETWNLAFFTMITKAFCTTSCKAVLPHHERNEEGGSP
jgi:hypothetical protein